MNTDLLGIPYQGIVEQSLAGMYVIQDEKFVFVNETFAGMLGYTPDEMTGMHLKDAITPESVDVTIGNFHRRIRGEVSNIRYITVGRHKNGSEVILDVHGSGLTYQGRPAVVGVGIDVTEQVRQREELIVSRERLRDLAHHINTVREEQRARFAMELHDVVGGMLTSIKLDVHRVKKRSHDATVKQILSELSDLVQDSIDAVRAISEDLRPGALDNLGLHTAIRNSLTQFSKRTSIRVNLSYIPFTAFPSSPVATAMYRIFQEALTNVARHAGAQQVWINLRHDEKFFVLEVLDDGCGIYSNRQNERQGFGMLSMMERAKEFDGSMCASEREGGGTSILVKFPVESSQ